MAGILTPKSFGGNSITTGSAFYARFPAVGQSKATSSAAASPVDAGRPGRFPAHVRAQLQARTIEITVEIKTDSQANHETLKKYFDPHSGEQYLIATDDAAAERRIACIPLSCEPINVPDKQVYRIMLHAATGVWEAVTATTGSEEITASGETVAITNAGNTRVRPVFTITPGTVMADTNSWIKRRRVIIANRSPQPYTDPVGDGWPVDLAENAWDTDALQTAGKVLSSLNDVRTVLKGREIYCWKDPTGDDTTTKLWVNLQMRSMKSATLAAAIDDNDTSLTVNNATFFAGWPDTGFGVINNECFQYTARTLSTMTIVRGARNTTAASHSAGDTLYWVEHPFFDVIYDYANAADPAPPDDRKPMIDLATSLNTSFKWVDNFLNANDRRSAAWQPLYTDEGPTSDWLTLAQVGGTIQLKDLKPTATRPNFNNVYLDVPVGIAADPSSLSFDTLVQANMLLHLYSIDLAGNEVLLAKYEPNGTVAVSESYTLDDEAFRVRFNGRIGAICGNRLLSDTENESKIYGSPTTTYALNRIVFDDDVKIRSLRLSLKKNGSPGTLNVALYDDAVVDAVGAAHFHATVAAGDVTTSFTNITVTPDEDYGHASSDPTNKEGYWAVPAGTYWLVLEQASGTSAADYYAWQRTTDMKPQPRLWVAAGPLTEGVAEIEEPADCHLFSIHTLESEAQEDAPLETEDHVSLDNIILPMDSTRTPKIVFAPEEVLYLLNARLKNDTTGQYIDLFYPMELANNVQIDCENRRVIDSETGLDIPFIASCSDPSEWIYLNPGSNTISYTETGVVSTTLAHSFRARYL